MLYGSCNDSEWWLAFIMHNLYTKLRILGVVTDYHHVHTYIHITMGSKITWNCINTQWCYSLMNMRQIHILFNEAKTWNRIVCWFLCFYQFLHDVIQGRWKVWKSEGGGGACSTVVGIICLHGWDRVQSKTGGASPWFATLLFELT